MIGWNSGCAQEQEFVEDPERNNVSDCVYECKIRPDCKGFQASLGFSVEGTLAGQTWVSKDGSLRNMTLFIPFFAVFIILPWLEALHRRRDISSQDLPLQIVQDLPDALAWRLQPKLSHKKIYKKHIRKTPEMMINQDKS